MRHKAGEQGRGEFQTNTIEGSFSIFKRGMKCVCQHCAKKRLHRYLADVELPYNNSVANGADDGHGRLARFKGLWAND